MKFANPFTAECPKCNIPLKKSPTWFLTKGQVCPHCGESIEPIRLSMEKVQAKAYEGFCELVISLEIENKFSITIQDELLKPIKTVEDILNLTMTIVDQEGRTYSQQKMGEEIYQIIRDLAKNKQLIIQPETRIVDLGIKLSTVF